jgi:uncharacterized protein (TIGR00730 family)
MCDHKNSYENIMRVTVFGGSQPKPNDPAYQEALELGRMLGSCGHMVFTGGYIGMMEAVSRGANECGGHVVGVTCDEIESWRPVTPNRWVQEEMRYPTLRQRMYALIENCDAAMALPGGIGTLAEIVVMWTQLQTRATQPRPLILIGQGWRDTVDQLFSSQGLYIAEKDREWLMFAPDVHAAVQMLNTGPKPP